MSSKREDKFTSKDYSALGLSLLLAVTIWFIHYLSLEYSDLVQNSFVARCELDGHSDIQDGSVLVAARCNMSGYGMLRSKFSHRRHKTVVIATEDMHHIKGDDYFMAASDINKYFHDIFGDKAHLEYFITDTIFFRFPSMNFKKVPVRALSNITFKPQYMSPTGLRTTPDSVLVYGRNDQLDAVREVNTRVIIIHGASSDTYGVTSLSSIDKLRMSTDEVEYSLPVVRYVEQKETVPVVVSGAPLGTQLRVLPSVASVKLRSVFPGLESFDGIRVEIDYKDYIEGISGKCVGQAKGLPQEVLGVEISPSLFDCFAQQEAE